MFILKKPNYTIEKFISNEKYTFPSVKNLNAIEVVKIYNFFSSIFPKVTKKTHSTKVARKLENILDNFDVLLLDAFGVLNCGDTLYSGNH